MSSTFPRLRRSDLGYDPDQVEEFLEEARRAYQGENSPGAVTAASIRRLAFAMAKGGYSPSHVDAALERLEDAFARRERERAISELGDQAWYAETRATAQAVLDRVTRPRGRRFRRTGALTAGYSVRDVDAFTDRIASYLQQGTPLEPAELRASVFRPQRGGYQEAQVDLLLDTAVEVVLAVKQ